MRAAGLRAPRPCLLALSRALASPARRSRSRVRPLPAGGWAPQVRGGEGAEPGPACPRPRLPLRCVCNKIDADTLVYQLGPAASQGLRNPMPPTGIRPCLLPHYRLCLRAVRPALYPVPPQGWQSGSGGGRPGKGGYNSHSKCSKSCHQAITSETAFRSCISTRDGNPRTHSPFKQTFRRPNAQHGQGTPRTTVTTTVTTTSV